MQPKESKSLIKQWRISLLRVRVIIMSNNWGVIEQCIDINKRLTIEAIQMAMKTTKLKARRNDKYKELTLDFQSYGSMFAAQKISERLFTEYVH